MNDNVLAIIPARGGSKGIPRKNIKELHGKPLIYYTINAARKSKYINKIILSTEDDEIAKVGKRYGIEVPFLRPKSLAEDNTPTLPVIMHAIKWLNINTNYVPDIILILQVTSPIRNHYHIDESLQKLISCNDADSIVSVTKVPHQYTPESIMIDSGKYIKNMYKSDEQKNLRQLKKQYYARNGAAIYGFKLDCLLNKKSIYGDKILKYEMGKLESIDIDDIEDFKLAEYIIANNQIK